MRRTLALLIAVMSVGDASGHATGNTRRYISRPLGVAMRYPAAWHRITADPDQLFLVRPDMMFRGPIQPHGQARITVGPSVAPDRSEAAVIRFYGADGTVRAERPEPMPMGAPCRHLARATLRQDVVPPESRTMAVRDIVSTILICTTRSATMVGTASAWADDPQAARATRDLLTIMRSLTPVPYSPPRTQP